MTPETPTEENGDAQMTAYGTDIFQMGLEPGHKVLWGDRKQPCTVARVVDADDHIGQALTAGVVRIGDPAGDTDLQNGDVFLTPSYWGMTGKKFILIHGPRGGFYALVKTQSKGRPRVALFRAVRTYHKTRAGHKGHGAFQYDSWFGDELRVVGKGDAPAVLDEGGDLPHYDDIKDNRVMVYISDDDVRHDPDAHHREVGTVEEVFQEGLHDAHDRVRAEAQADRSSVEEDDDPFADVPSADRVSRKPMGQNRTQPYGTVTITGFFRDEEGVKATIETPAPWEVPDRATPPNEVIKNTPYPETMRAWDPDREAWTALASELSNIAYDFAYEGYFVTDDAPREL